MISSWYYGKDLLHHSGVVEGKDGTFPNTEKIKLTNTFYFFVSKIRNFT